MFDYKKAKENARQLYHFCHLMKDYSELVSKGICTEEEERYAVIFSYIAELSDDLYVKFIDNV